MKNTLTCVLVLGAVYCFGQTPAFLNAEIDTNYINKLPSKWSARIYAVSKYNRFYFSENGESHLFYPDVKVGLGLGVSYKNFALDLAANSYSSDPSQKSKNIGLLSSLYSNQNIVEFSLQVYEHFTSNSSSNGNEEIPSEFRKDIRAFNFGLNYNYNFNHQKFSFNAPFIATQIQKKSAGSPLAGAYFSYFDLRSDTPLLAAGGFSTMNSDTFLTEANLLTVGLTGGYAYTFVLPAHFYITLSANAKLAYNIGEAKTVDYFSLPFQIQPGFLTRDAIGYAGKRFYSFASVLLDYNRVKVRPDTYISYDPIKVKFLIGYRFN